MAKRNCGPKGCNNKTTFNNQRLPAWPSPVAAGSIVNNDFSSSSWTYSGAGTASFASDGITMSGGNANLTTTGHLRYTALPMSLKNVTITARVQITNITASDGVPGAGFLSRRDATLKRFVILNCSTGADQGNMLRFLNTTFEAETQPSKIAFTDGQTVELVMELGLISMTFKARNYTTGGAFVTLAKTLSITFGSGDRNLPDIWDYFILNYTGTNKLTYFDISTTEKKYADITIGTSKVHGFDAATEAATMTEVYETLKGRPAVNLGAQSCALQHFVLLNPLITLLKPRRVIFADPFRNNISGGTFNATNKANFITMVTHAESLRAECWYQYALPEAVLDQAAGDAYLITVVPLNHIAPVPTGWAHGTKTSDGTHPNVAGNLDWGTTLANFIP